jgi:DNA-binding PadR family transcriptional regulator
VIGHDPELPAWLALRRVHRGGITRVRSGYVDRGQRIPGYIADALDTLVPAGLVTFGEPDPAGYRQVALTPSGQARLAELSTRLDDPCDSP